MMQLSLKMRLALLWGVSVLFSTQSMSASIPETSSVNSTAEPSEATTQLISGYYEPATQPATWQPTHKPAQVSVPATPDPTVPPTVETEEPTVAHSGRSSNDNTTALVATYVVAGPASSSGPRLLPASTAATAAASEARPSHNTTISDTARPTGDQSHVQSPTTSTDVVSSHATTSATASATSLATETVSSPQPTSTTKPEATSSLSSPTSITNSTQTPVFIQNLSSPSASATSTVTAKPTSESTPVFDPTFSSSPVTIAETSTNSTEVSSTSQPVTVMRTSVSTSESTDAAGSTAEPSTISFLTDSANATTAIFIKVPIQTTKPTPTAAPCEVSKSPPSTDIQPCSTWGTVKQCLITIASLAVLATFFMVTTIILCTKLSTRKHRARKPQQDTELMCISALLPERNYTYTRQRNPVTNGVLVIHTGGDSDEDGGDNLTLSSFLPENDRNG